MLIAELNRIASHLVAMCTYGLDLGSFTPFLYAFRERERILDLFEEACGARLTYSYITPGGATADLPPGWLEKCAAFLDQFVPVIDEFHTLLTSNAIFIKRTAGIGVLPPELAISYGCTGPVLRGSGVDYDLRRDGDKRYTALYEGYQFSVVVQKDGSYPRDHKYPPVPKETVLGDSWHRFYVRMLEVVQSMDLIRQAMDRYRQSRDSCGVPIKVNQKLPKGEAYLETECPRGQMGFYLLSLGDAIPWRVRARSSCFCNLSVLAEICRNCLVADVPGHRGLPGHRDGRNRPLTGAEPGRTGRSHCRSRVRQNAGVTRRSVPRSGERGYRPVKNPGRLRFNNLRRQEGSFRMPLPAVIFDLDGTLLDTLQDIAEAANSVLAANGFPEHPLDAYRFLVGSGVVMLFQKALPESAVSDEAIARCAAQFRVAYERNWNRCTRPYPGIRELLGELQRRGVPMAVLSNKPDYFTKLAVAEYFPDVPFAAVLGDRPEVPRKPDPTSALEVAGLFGVPVEQILYLGDTAVDMQTAVAAGMQPIGACGDSGLCAELEANGAVRLIARPEEFLTLVAPPPEA